jgi:hypothetical protein
MTEPATTHPASYCPRAAHTLQWGLHPDSSTQGWILRDGSSVVAVLDGYPQGRTPVLAGEARAWADRILGTAQEWVEQPAGSGAYHRHNTVAAPEAAPPAGQAGLRDRIAEALIAWTYRGKDPEHGGILETVRANACSRADAVLAVLFGPIPAGTDTATWTAIRAIQLMNEAGRRRDAVLREAIARVESPERRALGLGWESAREVLRRMLHEDDPSRLAAETPGPETQGGPRFVRVCTACPVCDHTVDENGACENGCRTPAVVAEPGKEG